jgi:tetratricopeptide (TPR) repeat protein
MKRVILFLYLLVVVTISYSQSYEEIQALVEQGVKLHDAGKYSEAIAKYDEALKIDSTNMLALAEKSLTLLHSGKFAECVSVCEYAIETNPGGYNLDMIYINYATCYDYLKQPEKAVEKYDEGIALFPELSLLYFNKGITLSGMEKYDEAIECMKSSLMLDPLHAGSHNAIARLSHMQSRNIPALLAYCRFMTIEPEGKRAALNLKNIELIMAGSAEKTGRNSISININSAIFADTTENGEPLPDNFSDAELLLIMTAAMDFDKKYKKETEVERFQRKIETVFSVMAEVRADNHGFFWEFYAPYFIELHEKGYTETFSYIVYASSGLDYVNDWLTKNDRKIVEFYNWSDQYDWSSAR